MLCHHARKDSSTCPQLMYENWKGYGFNYYVKRLHYFLYSLTCLWSSWSLYDYSVSQWSQGRRLLMDENRSEFESPFTIHESYSSSHGSHIQFNESKFSFCWFNSDWVKHKIGSIHSTGSNTSKYAYYMYDYMYDYLSLCLRVVCGRSRGRDTFLRVCSWFFQ